MNRYFDECMITYGITYGLLFVGSTYGLLFVGSTYGLLFVGITYGVLFVGITHGLRLSTGSYFVSKLPTSTLHTNFFPWEIRR